MVSSGYGGKPQKEVTAEVVDHLNRAISLKPGLSYPHRLLALYAENYEYDRRKAETHYRRALELDPNDATTHHYFGEFLGLCGRFDEAEREMATASRMDPLSLIIQTDWGRLAWFARDYALAQRRLAHVLELDATFKRASDSLGSVLLTRDFSRTFCKQPEPPVSPRLFVCGTAGKADENRRALAGAYEYFRNSHEYFDPHTEAQVLAWYGEPIEAIHALERLFEAHEQPGVIGFETFPLFDSLRSMPEFQSLLRRTGGKEPEQVREDAQRHWGHLADKK